MLFLSRYKFWIGIGVAILLSFLLLFFVWLPSSRDNRRKIDEIRQVSQELERTARGEIKDERWIEKQKELKAELQSVRERLRASVRDYYPRLRELYDEDDAFGEDVISEFWLFQDTYENKMQDLKKSVEDNVLYVSSPDFLVLRSLDDYLESPPDELRIIEMEYWVQRAIVDKIIGMNELVMTVPIFHHLNILRQHSQETAERDTDRRTPRRTFERDEGLNDDEPALASMARFHKEQELFDIWPFELSVTLPFRNVADLLEEFARSRSRIEIVNVEIERERVYWENILDFETEEDDEDAQIDREAAWRDRDIEREMLRDIEREDPRRRRTEDMPRDGEPEQRIDRRTFRVPEELVKIKVIGYLPDYKGYPEPEEDNEQRR